MATPDSAETLNQAIAEGGAYEVLCQRLREQAQALQTQITALNQARVAEFGQFHLALSARVRVRTENNCIARDIVQIGECLLFGYNVYLGLKHDTQVSDVFALYKKQQQGDAVELHAEPLAGSFLQDSRFVQDFEELYRYYKHTKLIRLAKIPGKLLAGFQIGERLDDLRVFRWALNADETQVDYLDNRGERDFLPPPAFDFTWQATEREHQVLGRHPHVAILDTLFVETINGDLTVKVENNTDDGLGIYREPVEDATQSLSDASIFYADLGNLILLKIRPYKEEFWRYLVFNRLTQQVLRLDALGLSCQQLPENHGIIFPGGYYLQSGEYKLFESAGLPSGAFAFQQAQRSPNGEDVLYEFYEPVSGTCLLLTYNLIEKRLQNPIVGQGYALASNGEMIIFTAEAEAVRAHPMQIWQTPFFSHEYAQNLPSSPSFYGRIGNNELVRAISDLFSLVRAVQANQVSLSRYEALQQQAKTLFDVYHWLAEAPLAAIHQGVSEIAQTAERVVDEYEKVSAIAQSSQQALAAAQARQAALITQWQPDHFDQLTQFIDGLLALQNARGQLISLKELRYMDLATLAQLETQLSQAHEHLGQGCLVFLEKDPALSSYQQRLQDMAARLGKAQQASDLRALVAEMGQLTESLNVVSDMLASLPFADPSTRTRVLEAVAALFAQVNQLRAQAHHQEQALGILEARAGFAAQLQLFNQSFTAAMHLATTPETCDEQLAKCLLKLENLEGQFSQYDEFLPDVLQKREAVYEAFLEHKQRLLDARQQKAQQLLDAANRILATVEKRAQQFDQQDALNTYFATDPLVLKMDDLMQSLQALQQTIKADDIAARLKAIKNSSLRALRDKRDLFEGDGKVIKLGPRHKFSVNTQPLDLSLVNKEGRWHWHLSGTEYYAPLEDAQLLDNAHWFAQTWPSENAQISRAEFLAGKIMQAAQAEQLGLSVNALQLALLEEGALERLIAGVVQSCYNEGYTRGVHDHDAARIIRALWPLQQQADLLRFNPLSRALAQLFWANCGDAAVKELWREQAVTCKHMQEQCASLRASAHWVAQVKSSLSVFVAAQLPVDDWLLEQACAYLLLELQRDQVEFITSRAAAAWIEGLQRRLDTKAHRHLHHLLQKLDGQPFARWHLCQHWFEALLDKPEGLAEFGPWRDFIPEAIALLKLDQRVSRRFTQADVQVLVEGLLSEHPRIQQQQLQLRLDDFWLRYQQHLQRDMPQFLAFANYKSTRLATERDALGLANLMAKPLSAFVRNKLINDVYLPIIGDNLAKQMGSLGEQKRTDLMGLLMLISPPGYGKTTLMEYVAHRLGLIFVKINCPALGARVLSLDPNEAPNATAQQELQRINFALAMGNNVMLYLDDIQHTHPEFLQKFISLCDGTRRIEGVWRGQTQTFDLRGRKFCVVMAGNPYTESGEVFKVPDMLANRADVYNLGDILGGAAEAFALSYIENALTSNPVLAPLAQRDLADVYRFVALAQGQTVPLTDFSHAYSAAEAQDIVVVLQKLFVIQALVLRINQAYIASAAQDDRFREEPPFKLQGSYRNMNKMAEKISAVMNDAELQQMIADHYRGEAQMLTQGAEANLLKLAELQGSQTPEQAQRWAHILAEFRKSQALGGDGDTGSKVVLQLAGISDALKQQSVSLSAQHAAQLAPVQESLKQQQLLLKRLHPLKVELLNASEGGQDVTRHLSESLAAILPRLEQQALKQQGDMRDQLTEITLQLMRLRVQVDGLG
jgi:hypothetical protein